MTSVFCSPAFAEWTTLIAPSKKADKASQALMALTKNVKASELINLSEPLLSPKEFEALVKQSKRADLVKIDRIMHGDDFFYLEAGPIKVVFKWIDKEKIAYKINGHSFTYEEAAKTELWQNKIVEVVKQYNGKRQAFTPKENQFFKQSYKSNLKSSHFLDLGPKVSSMLILPFLFQTQPAQAYIDWSSKWTWGIIGLAVVALVANHYYRKHKKEHKKYKSDISSRLSVARANLQNARNNGEVNLSSYQKEVFDLENLQVEYNDSSNEVGFFGFLIGNRQSKPALYDTIISRPSVNTGSGTGTGVPGTPTAPPSNSSQGMF